MLNILFQDDITIVIDKPPGVLVHRNSLFPTETPILQRLRDQVGCSVWPVHRLDRQTSGCLIFTKDRQSIERLAESLRQGQKTYWAMVRGCFSKDGVVTIDTPIQGKEALSEVECLGRSVEPRCSLLQVRPKTGRNHQVRRHVRDLNHPILHDGDHGDSRVNRWWRENQGLTRLALHAGTIILPYNGTTLHVNCPLPNDLTTVFAGMPWWEQTTQTCPLLIAPANSYIR